MVISKLARWTLPYHEASDVVVEWFLKHVERLLKVTIVSHATTTLGFGR